MSISDNSGKYTFDTCLNGAGANTSEREIKYIILLVIYAV